MKKLIQTSVIFAGIFFSISTIAYAAVSVKNSTQHTIKVIGQNKIILKNNDPKKNWYWVNTGLSLKVGSHTVTIYDKHTGCATGHNIPYLPIEVPTLKKPTLTKRAALNYRGWYLDLYIDGKHEATICALNNGTYLDQNVHAEITIHKHKGKGYSYEFISTGTQPEYVLNKKAKLKSGGHF